MLGSELWEEHFDSLLCLVIRITLSIFGRLGKLNYIYYGDDSSQSQSSTGDLGCITGIEGQSGKDMCQPDSGNLHLPYIGMNDCCFAYDNGALSMACALRQQIEYHYYINLCLWENSICLISMCTMCV